MALHSALHSAPQGPFRITGSLLTLPRRHCILQQKHLDHSHCLNGMPFWITSQHSALYSTFRFPWTIPHRRQVHSPHCPNGIDILPHPTTQVDSVFKSLRRRHVRHHIQSSMATRHHCSLTDLLSNCPDGTPFRIAFSNMEAFTLRVVSMVCYSAQHSTFYSAT